MHLCCPCVLLDLCCLFFPGASLEGPQEHSQSISWPEQYEQDFLGTRAHIEGTLPQRARVG